MQAHKQHTNHLLDLVLVIIGPVLQIDSASLETRIVGVLHPSSPNIRGAELNRTNNHALAYCQQMAMGVLQYVAMWR